MEETVVRDKAVESLRSVASKLAAKQIEDYFIPMIKRLASGKCSVCVCVCGWVIIILMFIGEWFTSRTSACGLFSVAYTLTSNNTKDDLRT